MNYSFFKKNLLKNSIFLLVIFPVFSFASINFSEIMFDPEGSDSDREWIEIKNSANNFINLEKYKVCDSGSCHRLYEGYGNNFHIPADSFGIIAKKPEKFKEDYPNFSGFILRASFSLTNSKELLELKNEKGEVVSLVEYNIEVGGKNGNSFSLFDDIWKNGKATPNAENIFQEEGEESNGKTNSSETKIDRTYVEISDIIDGKKKIKAEIIDNIPTLIAGAENEFNGRAYGITGIEIKGAEYFWNLGDGKKEYGKNIKHTFLYPGEYILTLVVKSANFTGNTRRIVKVVEPNIEILAVDVDKNWIKLKNNYFDILKLDGWFLMVDDDKFKIPKETYILAKNEIIFPNKITNLDVREDSKIFLLFPNEEKVTKFIKKEITVVDVAKKDIQNDDEESVVEKVKNIFTSKKKKRKKKKTKKKKYKIEKKNSPEDNNDYFFRNSFFKKEKKDFVEVGEVGGNFAEQNFLAEKTQRKKILKIQNNNKSFWMENMYFILFIFFIAFLALLSFLLNYFEDKNKDQDDLNSLASEFEIEEI